MTRSCTSPLQPCFSRPSRGCWPPLQCDDAFPTDTKARKGCRLLVCGLPRKSPWLNPIEPRWAHGKRAVVEPERKLTGAELKQRLCAYYGCPLLSPLAQK